MASPNGVTRVLFTLSKEDLQRLDALLRRSEECGLPLNKSELVRAGLSALLEMPAHKFAESISAVECFSPGPAASSRAAKFDEAERDALIERIKGEYGL